ncbi:MAG: hypothetical protein K8S97_07535, partial [Anaerolineae bacterium]|nr:hypothetical protein [Anaerolineae bacterium]
HRNLICDLERDGMVTTATVLTVDTEDAQVEVEFSDPGNGARTGVLDMRYYDVTLTPGQTVAVLRAGSDVVLSDEFVRVKGWRGHLWEPLIIMGLAWGVLVIRPEFLYIGYIAWDEVRTPV